MPTIIFDYFVEFHLSTVDKVRDSWLNIEQYENLFRRRIGSTSYNNYSWTKRLKITLSNAFWSNQIFGNSRAYRLGSVRDEGWKCWIYLDVNQFKCSPGFVKTSNTYRAHLPVCLHIHSSKLWANINHFAEQSLNNERLKLVLLLALLIKCIQLYFSSKA